MRCLMQDDPFMVQSCQLIVCYKLDTFRNKITPLCINYRVEGKTNPFCCIIRLTTQLHRGNIG